MLALTLPKHYGVTVDSEGCHFVLYGPEVRKVELVLFDETDNKEVKRFVCQSQAAGNWLISIDTRYSQLSYCYCVETLQGDIKWVADPFAKELSHAWVWDALQYAQSRVTWLPKARIEHRQSYRVQPLAQPIAPHKRVLYEMHIKGISKRHPDVPAHLRGTYLGAVQPCIIEHLHALGVTTLQIMPLMAFMPEPFITDKGLTNYWGYNTASFFAPDPRYAYQNAHYECQQMVDKFHQAGFEVILDVAFNHTAEGGPDGPEMHFSVLNPSTAYTRVPNSDEYANYTGCGNTVNLAHRYGITLVTDALRHWCNVYGMDGFRYDLATDLGRQPHSFSPRSGLLKSIQQDPVLRTKLHIAEPWDMGDFGYQLGNFPESFAEINDQFRDVTRDFWRGTPGTMATFATRFFGSRDIFHKGRRASFTSVNGVTFHDGFTLHDLVTYQEKHNLDNREDNRDGHNHNLSHNYGVEGETDDVAINLLRGRQKRNLFASQIFAQGTPLILMGDELSRTQQGNNNAYCQDNHLNYCHWSLDDEHQAFLAFCRYCIELKQSSFVLTNAQLTDDGYFSGSNIDAVNWYKIDGTPKRDNDWHNPEHKGFVVELVSAPQYNERWLIAINADYQDHHLVMPVVDVENNKDTHNDDDDMRWQVMLDTRMTGFKPQGQYFAKAEFVISNRSIVLFKMTRV